MSPFNVIVPWHANDTAGYVMANGILGPAMPYVWQTQPKADIKYRPIRTCSERQLCGRVYQRVTSSCPGNRAKLFERCRRATMLASFDEKEQAFEFNPATASSMSRHWMK